MADYPVQIAPSLMCADLCNFGDNVRRLEACGVDTVSYTHLTLPTN